MAENGNKEVFYEPEKEQAIKRVLFCRHGQGYHNELDENGNPKLQIPDPELTPQGIKEARAIFSSPPMGRSDFCPEVVFVSPLWRTLQTATYAMECHPSSDIVCPMIAMDDLMEHQNLNACNHRRPIGTRHREAFPGVDFSAVEVEPPPKGIEWATGENASYKESFQMLRHRADRALKQIGARPEKYVVAVCHGSFLRALMSNVFQLGPHHAVKSPKTGESIEILQIQTPDGEHYWELSSDDTTTTTGREVFRLAFR